MQKHTDSLENQQALLNLIAQARSLMANEVVHDEQEQLVQQVVQETHDAFLLPDFTFSDEHDSLLPPADADDYEIDGRKRRRSSLSSSA
jgi:DNA-nicking Smr family endonuclease